jgi:hypothetical protein
MNEAMAVRRSALLFGQVVLLALSPMLSAQPRGEYAANLAALYGEYQWVLAVREACNKTQSKQQADLESALGAWRERHRQIIDDREERVAAMVRKASKDQRDYSRNYARSQSEVLKQRDEERKRLLALPNEDLQRLCTEFPGYLRDARSDIPTRLPEEFAAIYGKKLP